MTDSTPGPLVIAGGSGFLGRALAAHLHAAGHAVVVLSRRPGPDGAAWTTVTWDGRTAGDWVEHLDGAAALINLAGRSVDCVKTPDHCDEILRSRVESTRILGTALRTVRRQPPVWVQMSTAHIYGDPPQQVCGEDAAVGYGLAPTVASQWEQAYEEGRPEGVRGVVLRTSFVLGSDGGALPRLVRLARWGLGGTIGHGRQGMSWIHLHDLLRLVTTAVGDERYRGTYLATSPQPVSNAVFMRSLRRVLRQPLGLPAPAWLVRLGAPLLMRSDPELALYGRYCVSRRLVEIGFTFAHPELEEALRDLLRS